MKIVITGCDGRLGKAICARVPGAIGLTRRQLDICNRLHVKTVLRSFAPDIVINCAGFTNVNEAENQKAECWLMNADAPTYMAQVCKAYGILFVHMSTDYVFHGSDYPITEDEQPNPIGQYAVSKWAGEDKVLEYDALVFRLQWLYHLGSPGFIPRTLYALERGAPIKVVTDQIGCPTDAEAVAPYIINAAQADLRGLYHLASCGEATAEQWAQEAASAAGLPFKATRITRAELEGPPRPHKSVLDCTKLERALQCTLPHWRDSIHDAVKRHDT